MISSHFNRSHLSRHARSTDRTRVHAHGDEQTDRHTYTEGNTFALVVSRLNRESAVFFYRNETDRPRDTAGIQLITMRKKKVSPYVSRSLVNPLLINNVSHIFNKIKRPYSKLREPVFFCQSPRRRVSCVFYGNFGFRSP